MNLLSVVLVVEPATPDGAEPHLPLGPALEDWALEVLGASAHGQPRPFTVSGWWVDPAPAATRTHRLRLTALTEPVAQALAHAAHAGPLRPQATFTLAGHLWRVARTLTDPHADPWAAATRYETLTAPWLLGHTPPDHRLSLLLASPTAFATAPRPLPVPLPGLLMGGLLDTWNAFAPVAFPLAVRGYAEDSLALARYDLHTRTFPPQAGGLRVGAVGRVTLAALNPDRYWLSIVHVLADFALFAGLGVGTTLGFGQARRVPLTA